jgi:cold shock CspA family protein/ribosome-associated translation inhibitor RaiA
VEAGGRARLRAALDAAARGPMLGARREEPPMVIPLEITFRHMARSEAIEEAIRRKAQKLDQLYARVTSCRVLVEALHQRPGATGIVYAVRVDVIVPGGELVARREPPHQHFHEDVSLALRDAFDGVCRELQDYAKVQRGDVKTHEPRPEETRSRGRVVKLFPDRGYGFLASEDGHEVYFHEHSVRDGAFPRLGVGAEVRFEEEEGERGPQASSVEVPTQAREQREARG